MDTEEKTNPLDDAAGECAGLFPAGEQNMEFDGSTPCFLFGEYRDVDLLTKEGMMRLFKCTSRTVQRMVERYEIPPATSLAGRSVWNVGRLKAWVANMAEAREAEAMKQAKRMHRA